MVTGDSISTMEPAERAGYLGAFAVTLLISILLLVFGIRRLMKRSEINRQRKYAAAGYQHQYAPQQMYGKPELASKKPPNMALSILMIVVGVILVLASLSSIAQGASGTA